MLTALINRSDEFQNALTEQLHSSPPLQTVEPRHSLCASSIFLAIEHGNAARLCFAAGAPQSATGLLRLQYEATVRGAWLLFAAPETDIALLSGPLDDATDELARKLPGASVMMKFLESSAPAGLAEPLREFHSVSWHGLNSYIHAGIHPLRRQSEGSPVGLAEQLVRNGNGMLHVAYRLLGSLTGSQAAMDRITATWQRYRDCLPLMPPGGSRNAAGD